MPPVSTDPKVWFLPSRDNPDSHIPLFTSKNFVEPLIDGEGYMQRFNDLINATRSGDFVYYTGWHLALDQRLIRRDEESRVDVLFRNAHGRNVDLRVLLSGHDFSNVETWKFFKNLDIPCVLDRRQPSFSFGSAHQKFSVIYHGGHLQAFCGGIDLTHDRWDLQTHSSLEQRDRRQVENWVGGWHDVHCSIKGPACNDLAETFRERWNDPRMPNQLVGSTPPPPITRNIPLESDAGPHYIQVLRTYACNNGYPFAKRGEFTARKARLHGISLARDYIYIEDQYFVSYEVADALVTALQNNSNLRVIVLVPETPENEFKARPWLNFHQNVLIRRLRAAAPHHFAIYHLRNVTQENLGKPIYVHAKIMIVDDVYVEIGSMNCNRRSMTHDAEISVAVVDSTIEDGVCKFARDLRLNLWMEHLSETDRNKLIDPISGFNRWAEIAGKIGVRAIFHTAALKQWEKRVYYNVFVDPQAGCKEDIWIEPAI